MRRLELAKIAFKASYRAAFHKGFFLGKMGYLFDEMTEPSNYVDHLAFNRNILHILNTEDHLLNDGIEAFCGRDYKTAFSIFERCEDSSGKNFAMGICYLFGKGVLKDRNYGIGLIKASADSSLCCKLYLAKFYAQGCGSLGMNRREAYSLFLQVIEAVENDMPGDLNRDAVSADMYYFCGEYAYENGAKDEAVGYYTIAARDMNFGPAYYRLGQIYYEDDPEKAFYCFEKAKVLDVNVSARYFTEDRMEVADMPIGGGPGDKLESISRGIRSISDIVENIGNLDPNNIMARHTNAVNEREKAESELERTRAERKLARGDFQTARMNQETDRKNADTERQKAEMANRKTTRKNERRMAKGK